MSRPSQASIAHALGVTRPRVTQLAKGGMPTESIRLAREWYADHVRPKSDHARSKAPPAPNADRDRRAHAEADMAEHRRDLMRGELVDAEGVLRGQRESWELLERAMVCEFPTEHARELAALTDPWAFECALRARLRETLGGVARQLMESDDPPASDHGARR